MRENSLSTKRGGDENLPKSRFGTHDIHDRAQGFRMKSARCGDRGSDKIKLDANHRCIQAMPPRIDHCYTIFTHLTHSSQSQ
jgi:hypothetical protein